MDEIWKDIKDYKGLYQVSNLGRVRSLEKNNNNPSYRTIRILKQHNDGKGYCIVSLHKNKKQKSFRIHRLVAEAFISNHSNYRCVNHKDENKLNNNVDNLEWCTYKYNVNYGTGLKRRSENNSKKVGRYSLDGKLLEIYLNATQAQIKDGFNHSHISECCVGYAKTHKGFIWKYI